MLSEKILQSFEALRRYCEAEGFKGWDPYDGLNSRIFRAIPLAKRSALCRLAVIQGFKRFRSICGVWRSCPSSTMPRA